LENNLLQFYLPQRHVLMA